MKQGTCPLTAVKKWEKTEEVIRQHNSDAQKDLDTWLGEKEEG